MKKTILLTILFSLLSSHLYGWNKMKKPIANEYLSKAESMYLKECNEENNADSCQVLSDNYGKYGPFFTKEPDAQRLYFNKTLKLREKACDKGDILACTKLWNTYKEDTYVEGVLLPADTSKASRIKQKVYSLAEKQFNTKDPVVLYGIAEMFSWVYHNYKKSDKYKKTSCKMGYYKACADIGSYKLVKKSCKEGNGNACSIMAHSSVVDGGPPDPKGEALYDKYIKQACDLGDAGGCYWYGWSNQW